MKIKLTSDVGRTFHEETLASLEGSSRVELVGLRNLGIRGYALGMDF